VVEKLLQIPNIHEISVKGQRILDSLPAEVVEEHFGKPVVIEVDSEEYFIGDTPIEATKKAKEKYPDKIFFLGRIGYRTAYTFKGRR
jgi:hypothetical protein